MPVFLYTFFYCANHQEITQKQNNFHIRIQLNQKNREESR